MNARGRREKAFESKQIFIQTIAYDWLMSIQLQNERNELFRTDCEDEAAVKRIVSSSEAA